MDKRTDDFIAEIDVRSDDRQDIKSIELFAHDFRVNDATGEVDFLDHQTRDALFEKVETAILLAVGHEIGVPAEPAASDRPPPTG